MMRRNEPNLLKFMERKSLYPRLKSEVVQTVSAVLKNEADDYCKSKDCLLKKNSAEDMESFSLQVGYL